MKPILALVALALAACSAAPPPVAVPATAGAPAVSPNRLTAISSVPRSIVEPKIRVGLLSDQPNVTFPRIAGGYYVVAEAGPSTLRRGFTVTAPLAEAVVRYAVQVATINDLGSVNSLVERIRTETRQRVDTVFDPATGQYRILAGDFETSEAGVPFRAQLTERGYGRDMLVVRRPSDQQFEKRLVLVDDEGDRHTLAGESLLIMPAEGETITIDQKPYRTAARVFINARGLLNIINELNLEDYLFGVVPAEMGPTTFDEIEALKAQAIAARTYAVRNLGQFRAEGFDICPGPACQAYKGFSGEHELSNRAVRESAGMIMPHGGKPIDALYTSTCGGETSDVSTMFPGRNDPYLKRARCVELEMVSIAGRGDGPLMNEQQTSAAIFASLAGLPGSGSSWSAGDVQRSVGAALTLAGASPASGAPASSRRRDVLRYLSAALGLPEKGRVLTMPEDRRYFFPSAANPDSPDYQAAAFLIKYGVVPAQQIDRVDLDAAMPRDELHALLAGWLREAGAYSEVTGKILSVSGREIALKAEGKTTRFTLPAGVPAYRRLADRVQEYGSVPVMIGDRAYVYLGRDRRPVAIVVQANYDGASFDRTSSFANWTRSFRADELVTTINRRNPITQLVDIRPTVIDESKRIAEMEVTAEGGRKFMLRGLPVRWSLNVPDNLFVYDKTRDADGVDRYTFYGKGWGHGTGFCQVGSYGMAFRGRTASEILNHYYSGIEIVPMTSVARQ